MQKVSLDELFFRNKRIREFMSKFREKDISSVMRDITLLGIELFESMNPSLLHFLAEDVENTFANFCIAKQNKTRFNAIAECNPVVPSATTNNFEAINGNKQYFQDLRNNYEFATNESISPTLSLYNCGYQTNPCESTTNKLIYTLPQYDSNIMYRSNEIKAEYPPIHSIVEVNQKRPVSTQIDNINCSVSESKIKAKSSSKWRKGDDSSYDMRSSINNINSCEVQSKHNNYATQPVNYQNCWENNSCEKTKQFVDSKVKNSIDFYTIYQNVNESQSQLNKDIAYEEHYAAQNYLSPMEEAKQLLQNQKIKIEEMDKRIESIPNIQDLKIKNYESPIKAMSSNSNNTRTRGKIAVYNPLHETSKMEIITEFDERPLSPMRTLKPSLQTDSSKEKLLDKSPSKSSLQSKATDSNYNSKRSSSNRNDSATKEETLQNLQKRDIMIAKKRREKFQTIRTKDNIPQVVTSNNYKNVKSKVNSVSKKNQNNNANMTYYNIKSQSPRNSSATLKRKTNGEHSQTKISTIPKTNNSGYSNIMANTRGNEGRNSAKPNDRKYYRQEDLMSFQYESVSSNRRLNIETNCNGLEKQIESKTVMPNKVYSSSIDRHQNFQSEIAINIPNNCASTYEVSLDKDQVYPYAKREVVK